MTRRRSIPIPPGNNGGGVDTVTVAPASPPSPASDYYYGWPPREAEKVNSNSMFTYWFSRSNYNNTGATSPPPAPLSPSSPPCYEFANSFAVLYPPPMMDGNNAIEIDDDAYQNRRSAFELTRMQSNDSLNSERHYAKSIDSTTSNAIPSTTTNIYATSPPRNSSNEYHMSPQATVAMSSPIMARRELSNPHQPPMQPQYHQPMQPQVLVDPNTGQQYYFPAAPQPQFYYPLVPAAPMYYHQPQGYIVTSQAQPIPPQSPTQPRAMFFHPQHQHQQQPQPFNSSYGSGGGYFVEHPPSSNVSVCGGGPQEPEYFQRNQTSRHSMESGSSGSTSKHATPPHYSHHQHRRRNSRDSMSSSPAPSTIAPSYHGQNQQHQPLSNTTSFAHMSISNIGNSNDHQQHPQPSSPTHQQQQIGKFSTTSSCTSGFASGTGESLADHPPFNNSLITNRQRPVWWGTSEPTTRIGIDEKQLSPTRTQRILAETHSIDSNSNNEQRSSPSDEKTPTLPQQQPKKESSPQEAMLGRSSPPESNNVSAETVTPPKPIQKAIRMDFDFNAPIAATETVKEKTPPVKPINPGTAFTVTFDNETSAKKSVSLQDAARQAPTSRRMMSRRSVPSSASSSRKDTAENSESEHQDPKHYLFNKMIQGFKDSTPTGELNVLHAHKDDIDTLSEAGTYVVDTRSRRNELDRYIDSDSSDDESSSTVSDTPPTSARQLPKPLQQAAAASKSKPSTPTTAAPAGQGQTRQSLLATRLQQLRDRSNAPVTTKTSEPSTPSTSTKPSPPIRPCQKQPAASTSNSFRPCRCHSSEPRGDGGRFSMRAGPSTAASSTPFNPPSTRNSAGSSRPPFRAGLPSSLNPAASKKPPPPATLVKDTPEMVAWLRRKEYDPRKSAAEAKKIQQLKARLLNLTSGGHSNIVSPVEETSSSEEQIFQQNRSLSFHPGSSEMSFKRLQRDQRSNKSHDDLSCVGEDDAMMGHSNELQNQVDALTQKCLKSIQLIKICNQNTLSESVENLLERVVQPSGEEEELEDESQLTETISDQLQRLSSAFDAIQKYFEEQRSGSVSPPTFRNSAATESRPKTVGTSRSPPANRQQRF